MIRANDEYLRQLIFEKKANIRISGRAKFMPASVEKAFTEIIGGGDEGKEYIQQMKKQSRYQQEVW